jgi:hypothetical protein
MLEVRIYHVQDRVRAETHVVSSLQVIAACIIDYMSQQFGDKSYLDGWLEDDRPNIPSETCSITIYPISTF